MVAWEDGNQINENLTRQIYMFSPYSFDAKSRKRWHTLSNQCQRRLTEQQITSREPGTILKDVNTVLEFVGPDGIVNKSRNASFPPERLQELNAKVGHPIQLDLKRALLRDYPNLAGLFVLLRVMDLLQVKGHRLVVCPAALEFWRGLNCTEQYFALLEALLFQAHSSVLKAGRTREDEEGFETIILFLGQLSERWRDFRHADSVYLLGPGGELPPWKLFAQQQLGLIQIRPGQFSEQERRHWGGNGWLVGGVKLTPWGTAIAWALLEFQKEMDEQEDESGDATPTPNAGEFLMEPTKLDLFVTDQAESEKQDNLDHAQAAEEETELDGPSGETEPEPEFGMLRPVFHPYFPEWQTVYARPSREARPGTHIFKVKLAGWRGIWRRLAVPPKTSLDELAGAILHAFKFDDDHMYDFRYRDQRGRQRVYNHPYSDEGPFTPEIAVAETDLALKGEMLFTFDYGDNWEFDLRLEQIEAGPCHLRRPKVIESAGRAPEQYPQSE